MRGEGETSSPNGTSRPFSNGSGASPLHKAALTNSANGRPVAMNGSGSTNGHTSGKQRPEYFGHDREEVTRILIQALGDLGYNNAASSLSQESGFELESEPVALFRNAVLQGEWSQAEQLLFGATMEEGGVSINGNGLLLHDGVDKNFMRFRLRQQKFLELLERRNTGGALLVLRRELTPLYQDTSKLHFLSSLLMCHSIEDLKSKADWDGAGGQSRYHLLAELSDRISPSVMLPDARLSVLLHQIKRNQISNCLYHTTATSPSLYQDHTCDRSRFPSIPVRELNRHSGEVWEVAFSHDGRMLASCGGDGTCLIYEVDTFEVLQCFSHNEKGVTAVSWSPNDKTIVTCSLDRCATLWDVQTGLLVQRLPKFAEPVSSCVWAPDGETFVTGCLHKEKNLCQFNIRGELIHDWRQSHRIQDLAVSPNGHYLVAMDHERHTYVYNFITRELEYDIPSVAKNCSVSISADSRYLLLNSVDAESRMIDLQNQEVVRTFVTKEVGGATIIRARYGGANESFVIHGSTTGMAYIWHKDSGQLVQKLEAHAKGCCNSVAWSPTDPTMFVTCGDDHKVRVWGNYETLERYAMS